MTELRLQMQGLCDVGRGMAKRSMLGCPIGHIVGHSLFFLRIHCVWIGVVPGVVGVCGRGGGPLGLCYRRSVLGASLG